MKGNSVVTVGEAFPPPANTGDSGCLITRYSMSTCCVQGAKAETKALNVKTCTQVVTCAKRDSEMLQYEKKPRCSVSLKCPNELP